MEKENVEKHPLSIRWFHWINFPLLSLMIWSGLLIYWANRTYWPTVPDGVFDTLGLNGRLADGLSYHFFLMWLFALNGICYVLYVVFSGEWRELLPTKESFKGAWQVVLSELGVKGVVLPNTKFNHAQRFAYTGVIVMALGSLVSGLAIYKPVQLAWLKNLLGGYEFARRIHFYLTIAFVLFFLVHVGQVIKAGWNKFRAMATAAVLVISLALVFGGFMYVKNQSPRDENDETPRFLRQVLEFNEKLWLTLTSPTSADKFTGDSPKKGSPSRINGDVGLESALDLKNWKMTVVTKMSERAQDPVTVTMDDLMKLPRTDILNQFKCIEGWSEIMGFSGVKFSDFINYYHLGTHSGQPMDLKNRPEDLYSYVGLETPDGEYYVSVDMKSMLNSQTILAYDMNGFPLTEAHGAPLRLAIPLKYGVKNLKRIGKITFSDTRLPDYWGERGYDWFIGL